MIDTAESQKLRATLCGIAAALLWSTTIAAGRALTETFGGLLTVALIHCCAAVISIVYLLISPQARRGIATNSRKYTLGCGALFLVYVLTFYQAVGLASSREQVVVIGIINYLWPALSLLLSIPILGNRTSLPVLLFANCIAFCGIALAIASSGGLSFSGLLTAMHADRLPYALVFIAAVAWGLYNNLSRKWGGEAGGGAVPLLIIASAVLLSPVVAANYGRLVWSFGTLGLLLFVAVFPTFLAYFFWDFAQRKGHHTLVNSMAYAIPVLSTLTTGLVFRLDIPARTWAGCLLVIAGAVLARLVIAERGPAAEQSGELTLREIIGRNAGRVRQVILRRDPD